MNRMTLPPASSTSRSTALSRSSNSPRNFVPATSAPMSRAMTRRFLRLCGHVAVDDPQGEALDDRRLAHARLADQHRVVLRPPREDLDDAADFLVAADHRIELALPGPLDQVDPVALQRLELVLGVLVGHPGAAADGLQRGENLLLADGVELQDVAGLRVGLGQGQQQVLGRDELVLHVAGFALGRFEHADQWPGWPGAPPRRRPWGNGPTPT